MFGRTKRHGTPADTVPTPVQHRIRRNTNLERRTEAQLRQEAVISWLENSLVSDINHMLQHGGRRLVRRSRNYGEVVVMVRRRGVIAVESKESIVGLGLERIYGDERHVSIKRHDTYRPVDRNRPQLGKRLVSYKYVTVIS